MIIISAITSPFHVQPHVDIGIVRSASYLEYFSLIPAYICIVLVLGAYDVYGVHQWIERDADRGTRTGENSDVISCLCVFYFIFIYCTLQFCVVQL
jgi:hypothetical protein